MPEPRVRGMRLVDPTAGGLMLRPGLFLKHKRYRDVCIRVEKAGWYGGRLKGRGQFWNLGHDQSWPLGIPTKFEINREALVDWEWARPAEQLRTAEWRGFT